MLLPPLDPDKTIFNGGTFLLAAADSSDTSSSEWSRLAGFFGLFVAEVDPEEDDGLFLSLFSVLERLLWPPFPFPVDVFPI